MSIEEFKKSYKNGNIKILRTYIKLDKVLSTTKFITYLEKSFSANRDIYNILVLILFNKYDLNKVVKKLIKTDNVELFENILTTDIQEHNKPVLDENYLISCTVPKGRISMAKAIYEYGHGFDDTYNTVLELLRKYDFRYGSESETDSETDNKSYSVDSFIWAMWDGKYTDAVKIMSYVNPTCWDNFAIKFVLIEEPIEFIRELLAHDSIDPGIDDNWLLKKCIREGKYPIVNELLKHPLVIVENIDAVVVDYIIDQNCLCVAERLLRSGDKNIIDFFKMVSDSLIEIDNDVTYLAVKLGIITGTVANKQYLKKFKIDKHYIILPYKLNLDPIQICKLAFEEDDIDMAMSIINYNISIDLYILMDLLIEHKNSDVYNYVIDKLNQYDPTWLIVTAGMVINTSSVEDKKFYKYVFNLAKDLSDVDLEWAYGKCKHDFGKRYIIEEVRLRYSKKDFKKFLLNCED